MATTLPPELSDESLAWSSQMVVYHVTNTATKQYQGPSSTFLSKSFQKNCMRLVIRFFNVIISSAFWEFHMIHLDYIHPPQPQSFMSLIPHFRATPTNPSPNFRSFSFLHNPLSLMCAAHKRMSVGSLFGVVWIIFFNTVYSDYGFFSFNSSQIPPTFRPIQIHILTCSQELTHNFPETITCQ